MLKCIVQPMEGYVLLHESGQFETGIGTLDEKEPALFSIISIMSPILYHWEPGSPVPPGERGARLETGLENLYRQSLDFDLGGLQMVNWLAMMDSPVSIYTNLCQHSLSGMPLLQFYNVYQLRLIMRARCRSWLMAQKQPPSDTLLTLFTEEDEKEVKINAYGKYYKQLH